jgi:hypothetical protein
MTADTDFSTLFAERCTTAAEFNRALSKLLVAAAHNGVDVGGAWVATGADTHQEWDVVVTPLSRDVSDESPSEDDAARGEDTD